MDYLRTRDQPMSTTAEPLSLNKARELAMVLVADLAPHCERVEVAGSIRRGKPWVNDIEIVAIPKTVAVAGTMDLFGNEEQAGGQERDPAFVEAAKRYIHTHVKGQLATGRYVQFLTRTGVKVDLFMATRDNWGYILTIRTGSAEYSKGLAHRWVKMGYEGKDGMLTRFGKPVPLNEERDLFTILQLPWVPPTER